MKAERWIIRGNAYRKANEDEIKALRAEPNAPHVMFACQCGHGGLWSAKNIALSSTGHYNGQRNIFYCGDIPECECPGDNIVCVVEGY